MTRLVLSIANMECPNCAMKLEGLEDSLPGVAMVEASYRRGRMVVEYDESMLSEAAIQAAVEHMGYTVAAAKEG